jgi:UDP-N-acetylglucosamine--N-acetylmuramyl-(pentapeptide) pyrophosphoryl-undecaprenol N-acetylglucosamine transferase
MCNRRIVIAAGGTGGHVFPALSLAYQLKERGDSVQFIGAGLKQNPFFDREVFAFREILSGRPSLKTPGFPLRIARGTWQSVRALKEFQADLLIGFGSYYTLPVLLAARLLAVPYVIHEQNSVPGRVNRLFTRSAKLTAVHFPSAALKIRGKPRLVAMPLRPGFQKRWSREEAVTGYGLKSEIPVMLVFGGSQGAEAINRLLYESAPQLKSWQILHFTGNAAWKELLTKRYREVGIRACVKVFEADMAKAWGAADLAVSRAGAASIAEQIASAVPGILIPYPFATDRHQEINANYLVELGGGVKLSQSHLTSNFLIETIDGIAPLLDDMRNALKQHHVQQTALIDCLEVI